jgi:hypothetical protein
MSDGGPAEEETREDEEGKDVTADILCNHQFGNMSLVCVIQPTNGRLMR